MRGTRCFGGPWASPGTVDGSARQHWHLGVDSEELRPGARLNLDAEEFATASSGRPPIARDLDGKVPTKTLKNTAPYSTMEMT